MITRTALSKEGIDHYGEMFEGHKVPLQSPMSMLATLGDKKNVEVMIVDYTRLTITEQQRVVENMHTRLGGTVEDIRNSLEESGTFPIQAKFVVQSIDLRMFV